jgi:hypothetical protein
MLERRGDCPFRLIATSSPHARHLHLDQRIAAADQIGAVGSVLISNRCESV